MKPYTKTLAAVFVVLVALAAIWPTKNNPYKTVIKVLDQQQYIQAEDVQMLTGRYQNVMTLETVQLELMDTKQAQKFKVTAQKWPLFDWRLTSFSVHPKNK